METSQISGTKWQLVNKLEQTVLRGPAGLSEIWKRFLRGGCGVLPLEAFKTQMDTHLSELRRNDE